MADVLIVGAGAAGAACAEALRERGHAGSITVVGRELDAPYERPLASKDYLRGELVRDATFLRPRSWWDERGIDLRTRSSVLKLDTKNRRATLAGGQSLSFDHALIATGANVRRLRVEGADLEGIHYLRTLWNADAIRADAQGGEAVVLVGGSYLACEVASSLARLGKRCTLVMPEGAPLSNGFGAEVGRWVGAALSERGIGWLGCDSVARFEGEHGRVRQVITASGKAIDADLVVIGTGVVPDVMLARAAGLELGETGGIACETSLRTSAPAIWAAGDVCEYDSVVHRRRLRVEHWEVARAQGAHVAAAMLGEQTSYTEVPYFWSELGDWCTLEYVGPAPEWDHEVVRGSLEASEFTVFYLQKGCVAAALTVGRPDDLVHARRLLVAGTDLGRRAGALADEGCDLSSIA